MSERKSSERYNIKLYLYVYEYDYENNYEYNYENNYMTAMTIWKAGIEGNARYFKSESRVYLT